MKDRTLWIAWAVPDNYVVSLLGTADSCYGMQGAIDRCLAELPKKPHRSMMPVRITVHLGPIPEESEWPK